MSAALQSLVDAYVAEPSPARREAVVLEAVRLVRALAGRITLPDSVLASREDLEGAGLLGLLQALDTYDPRQGTLFVTHAYRRIQGALLDFLREIDPLSRSRRQKIAQAQQAIDTLQQALDGDPRDEDVADLLGVSLQEYHSLLQEAQVRFALSLDQPYGEEGEQRLSDTVADAESMSAFEAFEDSIAIEALQHLYVTLPERERTILALYYYEGLTLREIGGFLNLTEARISQILGKTLLKLRTGLTVVRSQAA